MRNHPWINDDRRAAFTLLELLIVISVIAVVAGLLASAVGGARKNARQVQCLNNLRQLGIAALSYAGDNEGSLPTETNPSWDEKLLKYLGTSSTNEPCALLHCPEDTRPLNGFARSYAFSSKRSVDDGDGLILGTQSRRLVELNHPSKTIMITERFVHSTHEPVDNLQFQIPYGTVTGWLGGPAAKNWPTLPGGSQYHGKGMNFCFADGHVQEMPAVEANTPKNLWNAVR